MVKIQIFGIITDLALAAPSYIMCCKDLCHLGIVCIWDVSVPPFYTAVFLAHILVKTIAEFRGMNPKDKPISYHILNWAVFYVSRLISSQKERDFVRQRRLLGRMT